MLSFLPYSLGHWLGIAVEYLISGCLIAGGLYIFALFKIAETNPLYRLLGPIRYLGLASVGCGIALACITYGKTLGAGQCEAAWRAKDLELKVATLERDLAAQKLTSEFKAKEAEELAHQKADADEQIASYQSHAETLSAALSTCRRSTDDDNKRLRDILGDAAKSR